MIALLQMELSTEAEDVLSSLEGEADSAESEDDDFGIGQTFHGRVSQEAPGAIKPSGQPEGFLGRSGA